MPAEPPEFGRFSSESPTENHDAPSQADVTFVLSRYPRISRELPQAVRFEEGRGFSGAAIWKLTLDGRECGLRAWPHDSMPRNRIHGLHLLLTHCHADGLRVIPVPFKEQGGLTWIEHAGRFWQLEPWMPGRSDYSENPNENRLKSAMHCLARWHLSAMRFSCPHESRDWYHLIPLGPPPGLRERMSQLQSWSPERLAFLQQQMSLEAASPYSILGIEILRLFFRLAPIIDSELKNAVTLAVPLQPCIRDIWHDHLLFTGDEVTGLIDFGACRLDTVATDLSRLLGSLVADDRPLWMRALAYYEQLRPLSVTESQLLAVCDHSAVTLAGTTWLDWLFLQRRKFAHPEVIVARLETILNRMRNLLAIFP